MPGPCDPEDLLDGVIFGAKYLGSTQLQSEKNPSTNARMAQAQEAVDRIKVEEYELLKNKTILHIFVKCNDRNKQLGWYPLAQLGHRYELKINNIIILHVYFFWKVIFKYEY